MIEWIDAHNHLQDERVGGSSSAIAEMKRSGVKGCFVNATREADWAAVESLAVSESDFVTPAFGIHPWQAYTAREGWQRRLEDLLRTHPKAIIGECGLDSWVDQPEVKIQQPVFNDHLKLAAKLERPIVIHCLKAWGALFDAFAKTPPPARFLMHSFGGSIETARRLIPMGAYFSFSGYFLQPRKSSVLDVFRKLPKDRILLETDAPDMLPPHDVITHKLEGGFNHPANLPSIGRALASALAMQPEELAQLTAENTNRCLSI